MASSRPLALADRAIARAHRLVHGDDGSYMVTDLTKTSLGGVQNRYFRLFTPVKHSRGRLPTTLPEFAILRHSATLSDSPVTAAAKLGGHWTDHNLAAITQLAACNLRCHYCYVDFRHLAGHDSVPVTAATLVREFRSLRDSLAAQGRSLSIFRVSGGEPLLAPELVAEIHELLHDEGLTRSCLLKVESNLSTLSAALAALQPGRRKRVGRALAGLTVHATLHKRPHEPGWEEIRRGIESAVDLGMNLFPAIGGTDWSEMNMVALLETLESAASGLSSRLAVRPFNLAYISHYRRRSNVPPIEESSSPSVRWENILRRMTGRGYLERPRHEIRLR